MPVRGMKIRQRMRSEPPANQSSRDSGVLYQSLSGSAEGNDDIARIAISGYRRRTYEKPRAPRLSVILAANSRFLHEHSAGCSERRAYNNAWNCSLPEKPLWHTVIPVAFRRSLLKSFSKFFDNFFEEFCFNEDILWFSRICGFLWEIIFSRLSICPPFVLNNSFHVTAHNIKCSQ